jgi:2-dehydropantoate 2-reductase
VGMKISKAGARQEPIIIWGSGAIGGTIGAYLRRAGHEVIFVDIVPEHVDAIATGSLCVVGPDGSFTVGGPAFIPEQMHGEHKLILLAVKSQDTRAAAQTMLPFLHPQGAVVSCQNGLNEPVIAEIVGQSRTIGCFVNFGADYQGPGHLSYGLPGAVVVGELDGRVTPRIEMLNALLQAFEPTAKVSDNIVGYLWGKMAYGALLKFTALGNETIADVFADPKWRTLLIALAQEVLSVAIAEGAVPSGFDGFNPDAFLSRNDIAIDLSFQEMVANNRGSGKPHTGVWRDLAIRRRPTEVAAQALPILQAAERRGLNLPRYRKLIELIGEIEAGRRILGTNIADDMLDIRA